jgi:hypothetical protein
LPSEAAAKEGFAQRPPVRAKEAYPIIN